MNATITIKNAGSLEVRRTVFVSVVAILENRALPNNNLAALTDSIGAKEFAEFLSRNGVSSILYSRFSDCFSGCQQLDEMNKLLREKALKDAATYLYQKRTLHKIHRAFEASDIKYGVFKGAMVRESLYPEAWMRPTLDIDILVANRDKDRAIRTLEDSGLRHCPDPEVFSHETSLVGNNVNVDLHWNILRPGRTRIDMTDRLLETSIIEEGFRSMNPAASMFILLVHPAISKYVCSPDCTLAKMVDVYLTGKNAGVNWQELAALIDVAGLRTAAWATTFWLHLLLDEKPFESLATEFKPPRAQSAYIAYWIRRDLPTRYYHRRGLMRTAFSMSLHDNVSDIYRATSRLSTYKRSLIPTLK